MEIKLYDILKTDTLRHRDTAKTILDITSKQPQNEKILIDFAGISFASRSFCHELKRGLEDRDAVFMNMMPEVEEMMRIAFSKPKIDIMLSAESKKLTEIVLG